MTRDDPEAVVSRLRRPLMAASFGRLPSGPRLVRQVCGAVSLLPIWSCVISRWESEGFLNLPNFPKTGQVQETDRQVWLTAQLVTFDFKMGIGRFA